MKEISPEVRSAIEQALATALPEIESIDWNAALTGDVGLDSVQIMNLVMEIEDHLDLSVPVDVLSEVQTLAQLAARLDQLKAGQA
jgi:acyl carrier protein